MSAYDRVWTTLADSDRAVAEREVELDLSDDRQAEWFETPLPAPERVANPKPLEVGVRLTRDPSSPSGWARTRIPEAELVAARHEILDARRQGKPCRVVELGSWDQFDPRSSLYDTVVLADPVLS